MYIFSYKVEHDLGLAPNPFHNFCTLAVCKSSIRHNKNLSIGDWVIGTGSKSLGNTNHLVYAMKVEEKIEFNEYWKDERFKSKKPVIKGSLVKIYGDNIYHQDANSKKWIQEDSAHSLDNGITNEGHMKRDIDGEYVLVSREFYYFGENAPKIPEELKDVCNKGRDMKYKAIPPEVRESFVLWLKDNYKSGIHGDPANWKDHL
ncbi:hypothetical protein IQ457_12050 [Psychrobacter sp. M9-54-1]|uniref:Nmad2 family putative nucleotide modification protein n=1 Tax=Psychrobacter sp. M9-54-1 TaxID=2782386 RepID=UPI001909A1A4|nr:hypothetical protein [Psychrobacter sp. M9-54-1]MBK3394660.1 hypothetical protein [Psychrobacter sp. M9-54-1]